MKLPFTKKKAPPPTGSEVLERLAGPARDQLAAAEKALEDAALALGRIPVPGKARHRSLHRLFEAAREFAREDVREATAAFWCAADRMTKHGPREDLEKLLLGMGEIRACVEAQSDALGKDFTEMVRSVFADLRALVEGETQLDSAFGVFDILEEEEDESEEGERTEDEKASARPRSASSTTDPAIEVRPS